MSGLSSIYLLLTGKLFCHIKNMALWLQLTFYSQEPNLLSHEKTYCLYFPWLISKCNIQMNFLRKSLRFVCLCRSEQLQQLSSWSFKVWTHQHPGIPCYCHCWAAHKDRNCEFALFFRIEEAYFKTNVHVEGFFNLSSRSFLSVWCRTTVSARCGLRGTRRAGRASVGLSGPPYGNSTSWPMPS